MQTNLKEFVARVGELSAERRKGNPDVWMEYKIRPAEIEENIYHGVALFATAPEMAQALAQYDNLVGELVSALYGITHSGDSADFRKAEATLTAAQAFGYGHE